MPTVGHGATVFLTWFVVRIQYVSSRADLVNWARVHAAIWRAQSLCKFQVFPCIFAPPRSGDFCQSMGGHLEVRLPHVIPHEVWL